MDEGQVGLLIMVAMFASLGALALWRTKAVREGLQYLGVFLGLCVVIYAATYGCAYLLTALLR